MGDKDKVVAPQNSEARLNCEYSCRLLYDWRQELAAILFGPRTEATMHFLELLLLGWLLFGFLMVAGLSWMCKKSVEALDNTGATYSGTSPGQVPNLAGD
jgi:hypothetical protein